MRRYRILEHPADLKVQAWGKDLPELFSNLACGMFSGVTEKLGQEGEKANFEVEGASDYETLLVNFLNKIWLVGFEQGRALADFSFSKFGLEKIKGSAKTCKVLGWKAEIKAATFYNLKIKKTKKGYETTVVFDI